MTAHHHRVHGLANDEVAPDWPPLEGAEVQTLLAGFPRLQGPTALVWHSPRPLSAAARVRTVAGEVFVKRHHVSVRNPATLAEEHGFMAHLRQRGIPVPEVLADGHGETAIGRGPWTYEVHALAHGIDLYRDRVSWSPLTDPGQARTAGRTLAHLHRTAADYHAPARTTTILVSRDDVLRAPDLIRAIDEQAAARPALADYLKYRDWPREARLLVPRHRLVQARIANLPRLWTHNDWHVSNLCWSSAASDAAVTAVLDFGLTAPTFALYDLATAIERNAIAWLQPGDGMRAIHPAIARALLDGYGEIVPLAPEQRILLADLLPVVHVDFALSEVEYYQGPMHSRPRADVAWSTFLLGHAAWFDTPPGAALLGTIRRSAG